MTLKVIGAGFGRTGTLSLKEALEKLGFGPCHHMKEVMLNSEQAEYFYLASIGESLDWDEVFKDYNSAVDWPAAAYYKELSDKYPDAKVICNGEVVMTTGSTQPEIQVDVWSGNHPFFTGTQKILDTEGRVDRFMRKYGMASTDSSEEKDKTPKQEKES